MHRYRNRNLKNHKGGQSLIIINVYALKLLLGERNERQKRRDIRSTGRGACQTGGEDHRPADDVRRFRRPRRSRPRGAARTIVLQNNFTIQSKCYILFIYVMCV